MLLKIYIKEMKDSLRDRRTLLLSVFLPILLLTGLTFYYENMISPSENETHTVAVASSFSQEEKAIFEPYSTIDIQIFADPEEAVSAGEAMAVLNLSENFMTAIKNGEQANAEIIGDSLSRNSSSVMSELQLALNTYQSEIITERMEINNLDPAMINPIMVNVKEKAQEGEGSSSIHLLAFLLPMIISISIGSGSFPAAADLFAGEKDKKTMEALLMTPVSRMNILLAKWLTIATIGTLTGLVAIACVIIEIYFFTDTLKSALKFGDDLWLIIATSILIVTLFALLMSALTMVASIAATSVKEAGNYGMPISLLTIVPSFFITDLGVNELTTTHFMIPFFNLYAIFKELLYGVVSVENILITVASIFVSILITMIVSRLMFYKDKWILQS